MGIGAVTPTTVAYLVETMTTSSGQVVVADDRADEYPQATPFTCTITEQGHSETVTVTSRSAGNGRFNLTRGVPAYAYTTFAKLRYTGPELQYPEGEIASTSDIEAAALEAQERRVFIDEETLEEFVRLVSQGEQDQAISLLWENLETAGG